MLNKMKYCFLSYVLGILALFIITSNSHNLRNKLESKNLNYKNHFRDSPQYVAPFIRKASNNYKESFGQQTPMGLKPRLSYPAAAVPAPVKDPEAANPHKTAVNIAEDDSKMVSDLTDNALKQAKLYELAKKFADEAVTLEKQASTLTRSMQEATSLAQQARNNMLKSSNAAREIAATTMKDSAVTNPINLYGLPNNNVPVQPYAPQPYPGEYFNEKAVTRMVQPVVTTSDNKMTTRMVPPTDFYNTPQDFGYNFQENNSVIKRVTKDENYNTFTNNAMDDYVSSNLKFNNNM